MALPAPAADDPGVEWILSCLFGEPRSVRELWRSGDGAAGCLFEMQSGIMFDLMFDRPGACVFDARKKTVLVLTRRSRERSTVACDVKP